VETDFQNHTATVTFDEEKTSVDALVKALAEGKYPIQGEPEFVK